ncbi:MAG TPA: alkaline phosphatase family protein [Kofleriaceae bacterium]
MALHSLHQATEQAEFRHSIDAAWTPRRRPGATCHNGPFWSDAVIFIVHDEHGGFYDHVAPPRAVAPDDIRPGQCADLSNPPESLAPGGGAECNDNLYGDPETSVRSARRGQLRAQRRR